ncbi:MAG TPA: hydantoinase B/oxoprolinase family protein, partial [Nannocystis sp.]
ALADASALASAFTAEHRQVFGYAREGHPIEITGVRVELRELGSPFQHVESDMSGAPGEPGSSELWLDGAWHTVPVWPREALRPGQRIVGPAIVAEDTATIVLEPGFVAEIDRGCLLARDLAGASATPVPADARDPVLREVLSQRITAIAQQMGVVLRRTALSTNIRERLDFSCAVFDARGDLVTNAPYIPVHLGAMPESIRGVLAVHPRPPAGAVYVTNDPAAGGSHLPDITVISPVHDEQGALRFFVASRGHHADVGGVAPGSMPPHATRLEEEGVVFRALQVVADGRFDREAVLAVLQAGPWPARKPLENLADLEAQIAANRSGARQLHELCEQYGTPLVSTAMQAIQDDAAEAVAAAIDRLPPGKHRFADAMDDGAAVVVEISRQGPRLHVDFTGTAAQDPGNLNAPRAVTVSALLYVLRLLAGRTMPLNSGCLRLVDLTLPPGLLSPGPGAAVAAGNVETAQRVVDVLLGALGLAAASQGTMNNLTFGDETFGYYETLGGGAGACHGHAGRSGVHTHMTNTRITDPEVLEARFPVRLWRFELRRGSGGAGRWPGGDGLVRELEFLRPMHVAILSQRRLRTPFGLAGGGPGAAGRNLLDDRALPGRVAVEVAAGQRLRIETPGGGGHGG